MELEKKYDVQVEKAHYEDHRYESEERFISYFTQKEAILNVIRDIPNPSVLEIGKGSGFLEMYLRSKKVHIKTFDFAQDLQPDYHGDVREMGNIVKETFDVVAAFEILEHIPFEDVPRALEQIHAISKKYVVISIPSVQLYLNIRFKVPLLKPRYFIISVPFPKKHRFNGEHYWELGKKGYSPKKFREVLEQRFEIKKEFTNPLSMFHRFYILEKKSLTPSL